MGPTTLYIGKQGDNSNKGKVATLASRSDAMCTHVLISCTHTQVTFLFNNLVDGDLNVYGSKQQSAFYQGAGLELNAGETMFNGHLNLRNQ